MRFLLVDKDGRGADRISSILEQANHTVLPANDIESANDALAVERFDAVLLAAPVSAEDLAALRHWTEHGADGPVASWRTPLLALTNPEKDSFRRSECSLDGYLEEPLDPGSLTEAVTRLAQAVATAHEDGSSDHELAALPTLEPDQFRDQVGGDEDLMIQIIDLFVDEYAGQLLEMRTALTANDWTALSRIAHTIKGSLGSIHATRSRMWAEELEQASKSGLVPRCTTLVEQMAVELEILKSALLELRATSLAA